MMPRYGIDYAPGWIFFEFEQGSVISEIIDDIQRIGELNFKPRWMPSHTWMVRDDLTGVEASTEGVAVFYLSKYLDNPLCQLIVCRPSDLTEATIAQMLWIADKMAAEGLNYDYSGLVGDALEAFTFLDQLIPALREVASPLHENHAYFCSALVATILNATTQYHNAPPMDKNTASKISPDMLLTQFNWDIKIVLREVK